MRVLSALAVLVSIVVALVLAAAAAPASSTENAVTAWSRIAEPVISVGRPPPSSQVLAAMVHAAIYDTVAAIEGELEPFAARPVVIHPADASAAVATSAWRVLRTRVPEQSAAVDAHYAAYIATIPEGDAKANGVDVGNAVAAAILDLRANDGFDNSVVFEQPTPGPGVWEPTAPTTPVDIKMRQVQPFTFQSPSDFRPNGPQSLLSGEYTRDFDEVKAFGRSDSTARTVDQTQTARFWTEQTYVQWSRTLRELAQARELGLRDSARLLGLTHVAAADALIACWEAKFYFNFWRPIHGIQRAETDGNPNTTRDATWSPLVSLNFPEYPSGHACFTGAFTEAIQVFFGTDDVPLTISSTIAGAGPPRHFDQLSDVRAEVANARIWAGLHFRNTMEEGAKLGQKVVHHVAPHSFRQVGAKR